MELRTLEGHKWYKRLMARIQDFIIKVRKAESVKREAKQRGEDPFRQKEEARTMTMPIRLKYAEQSSGLKAIEIRKVEIKDEKDEEERRGMEKIRCFLTHIRWKGKPERKRRRHVVGVYILFILHGGKFQASPMAKTLSPRRPSRNSKAELARWHSIA